MNILPHKSWNVWSAKNIARVERDEANARRDEEEKKRHAEKVEAERRFGVLRRKSKSSADRKKSEPERFSLFAEEEKKATRGNPEVVRRQDERQKREEQESRDYLGGKNPKKVPWYSRDDLPDGSDGNKRDRKKARDEKLKEREDPLPSKKRKRVCESGDDNVGSSARVTGTARRDSASPGSPSLSTLEKLKEERRAREIRERARIQRLMDRQRPGSTRTVEDDRTREYHEGYTAYSGAQRRHYVRGEHGRRPG